MTLDYYVDRLVDIVNSDDSFFIQLQCFSIQQQRKLCDITYVKRTQVYGIDFVFARKNRTRVSWITEASCQRVTGCKVDVFQGMELAASRVIERLPPFMATAYLSILRADASGVDVALQQLVHAFIWSHETLKGENVKLFLLDAGGPATISVPVSEGITKNMHNRAKTQDEALYENYFAHIRDNRASLSSHTHVVLAAIRDVQSEHMYYLAAFNGDFLAKASACGFPEKDVPSTLCKRYHHLLPRTSLWDPMASTSVGTALAIFETDLEHCSTCGAPSARPCTECGWARLCLPCENRRTKVKVSVDEADGGGVRVTCQVDPVSPLHTFCPYLSLTKEDLLPT